ncbi:hypothetical protein OnM2_042068 [Erysiphe neolycopersici]|uniref:Uncharacterized protein n=1 Tax=Erysiphe neolycopersici TaxID=212602 RepID=A0A420HVK2_9PEZI|nr:hypothetical protein OnM2_042068 [Erysiphe neolycopersici]
MSSSGLLPPTKNASQLMDTEPGGEGSQYEGQQVIFEQKSETVCAQSGEKFSSPDARSHAKEEIDEQERNQEKIRAGKSSSSWSMSGDHGSDGNKTVGTMGKANQGIAFGKDKK